MGDRSRQNISFPRTGKTGNCESHVRTAKTPESADQLAEKVRTVMGPRALTMASHYDPSPPWALRCPWCDWRVIVNARGAHGSDPGSGVEAARLGADHANDQHGRTWVDFLRESRV